MIVILANTQREASMVAAQYGLAQGTWMWPIGPNSVLGLSAPPVIEHKSAVNRADYEKLRMTLVKLGATFR